MEFFSKDPGKQLVEVKEKLTQRLVSRRREYDDLSSMALDLDAWRIENEIQLDLDAWRMENEIQFLEELLDQMERSSFKVSIIES